MNAYERGLKLLESLGSRVSRPKHQPEQPPNNGVCSRCDAVVVWATAATCKRMPFDVHPQGDWVIVAGNAVTFGPAHEGQRRYAPHFASCRQSSSNKETRQ